MIDSFREFLGNPFNRCLVLALLLIGAFVFLTEQKPADSDGDNASLVIHYFYSPTCPHCAAQKPFNAEISKEFPSLRIVSHDITVPEESRLLLMMAESNGISPSELGTPTTLIGKRVFVGFESDGSSGAAMREEIRKCLAPEGCSQSKEKAASTHDLLASFELPVLGKTDLSAFSLPVLAVVLGLLDGFNPCAMWVLVYLISIIMSLQDRKRMLWVIVGTFVLASGVLYFLFMTAWLNAFLFLGYVRFVTLAIGLIALGAGVLSIKDYFETKGLVCTAAGPGQKKRMMASAKQLFSSPLTLATLVGVVALAFTVNSVEFLCSAAIPATFTQVLALSKLPALEYYGYIALYDFFFMFDDLLVFGAAALTISNLHGEKYSRYCKFIGGAVLLVLGLLLVFVPQILQ